MMKRDTYLVEAVSGNWLRLPSSFRKAGCVVDLPNGIALNVSWASGRIEIYAKAEDQIYRLSGEMRLEADPESSANTAARIIYTNQPQALPGLG